MSRKYFIPVLIFVPLIIRLLFLYEMSSNPFSDCLIIDAKTYDDIGQKIAAGEYKRTEAFWQPPLYPYFLGIIYSVFGHSIIAAKIIQAFIGSISCLFIFILARRLFGNKVAIGSWIIASLYGTMIFFDADLLNVNLFIFLELLTILLLTDKRITSSNWKIMSGFVFGLAAITIPNILITLPILLLYLAYKIYRQKPDLKASVIPAIPYIIGVLLPVGTVCISNYAVSNEFVLISSNGGINFYIGNNSDYDKTVGIRPGRYWNKLTAEPQLAGYKTPAQGSEYFFKKSFSWIRENLFDYMKLTAKKTYLFTGGYEIMRDQEIYPFRQYSVILSSLLWIHGISFPYGMILPLGITGMLLMFVRRKANADSGMSALFALIYAVSVIMFFLSARYRLPVVPFFIIFACFAVSEFYGLIKQKNYKNAASGFLIFVVLGSAANAKQPPMQENFNSDAYFDLGVYHQDRGDSSKAEELYRKALKLNPDNFEAANNLAVILLKRNELTGPPMLLKQVLKEFPDDREAMLNLGNMYFQGGNFYDAGYQYLKVLRKYPKMEEVYSNLAINDEKCSSQEEELLNLHGDGFLEDLKKLFAQNPDNDYLLNRLLRLFEKKNKNNDAIFVLSRKLERVPEDFSIHYALARFSSRAGRPPDEIKNHIENAIRFGGQAALDALLKSEDIDQAMVREVIKIH
jgi:tetratricopeptide (TPR) repeat protein